MGERGPKGRSNHLKVLEGVREDRINRDEPVPAQDVIVPPVALAADAQEIWNRLAPDLIAKKVLTAWDVDAFAAFCRSAALYHRASEQAASAPFEVDGSHGGTVLNPIFRAVSLASSDMRAFGSRFGLTPGDRAELKVNDSGGPKQNAGRLIV